LREGVNLASFNDARCPKCNKRVGWLGDLKDRPPCPQCGHQIPLEELERAEEEMRAAEEKLLDEKGKKTFE
jgi:endogenous inhibitor of DNA gyrase (YacG/DUF329 family)